MSISACRHRRPAGSSRSIHRPIPRWLRPVLFFAAAVWVVQAPAFDMLDIELGKPYPGDPGSLDPQRSAMLPADTIRLDNGGDLAEIFLNFEIWVLNEEPRRAAFVMASRVFEQDDDCALAARALRAIIGDRLGHSEFAYAETVESEPAEGVEYVFGCHSPAGTPFVILNFVVRSGEMSREFNRVSRQKLKRFERSGE